MQTCDISKISENLYLGDRSGANNVNRLKFIGIEKILTVMSHFGRHYPKNTFNHKNINIDDTQNANIIQYFKECLYFIDGKEKILVHCGAGISRSATIIIAYIMWKEKKSLNDAIKFVKSKREEISPNSGFIEQLKIFEKLINENNYYLNEINFSEIKIKKI